MQGLPLGPCEHQNPFVSSETFWLRWPPGCGMRRIESGTQIASCPPFHRQTENAHVGDLFRPTQGSPSQRAGPAGGGGPEVRPGVPESSVALRSDPANHLPASSGEGEQGLRESLRIGNNLISPKGSPGRGWTPELLSQGSVSQLRGARDGKIYHSTALTTYVSPPQVEVTAFATSD